MQEIVKVAKEERLIILCTIHQPSTKVYNGFDMLMLLSKGREAFTGNVSDAAPYFAKIGYPVPLQTNPAEHFLDLVNADFSDDAEVTKILDTWEEERPDSGRSSHHKKKGFGEDNDGQEGVTELKRASLSQEISIMFRRSAKLIVRDPILYLGRAVVFLVANTIFALVYLKARKYNQDQALNKMWITVWHAGVASNMVSLLCDHHPIRLRHCVSRLPHCTVAFQGVVAVYALNAEFATILREAKNGMVSPLNYVLAKTILVLPIMFVFAIFALGIPAFAIMDFPGDTFGKAILLWAALMYVFECFAEALSVWFEDPILGMLQFMNFWFGAFLFGGFLISEDNLPWPFRLFYYFMPFAYYLRSQMYNYLIDTTWNYCDAGNPNQSPVCVQSTTGEAVLGGIGLSYPLITAEDNYWGDLGIMIAVAIAYKILYIAGVYIKGSKTAKVFPNEYQSPPVAKTAVAAGSAVRETAKEESAVVPPEDEVMHLEPLERTEI